MTKKTGKVSKLASISPKKVKKTAQKSTDPVEMDWNRVESALKTGEKDAISGAISTEKVGVRSQNMPSRQVSEAKKHVEKCGHCGKDIEVEGVDAEVAREAGLICDMCNTPDWSQECIVCGQKPVHRVSEMCGPCTFGEAETIDGKW